MKNAYLIIAHGNYEQLRKLVVQLDDANNDIFVHINKNVVAPDTDLLTTALKHSNLFFADRVSVVWGEYGILDAMVSALKCAATHGKYDYYHVLTGADIPLKTNKSINQFLEKNINVNSSGGKYKTNYIYVDDDIDNQTLARAIHYNLLVNYWRDKNNITRKLSKGINKVGYFVQSALHVNRLKKLHMSIHKGAPWWSITDELAQYVLKNEDWIRENFGRYTFGADELAIQTLVMNSEYKDSIYRPKETSKINMNVRLIDWKRGRPYTFRACDYQELIQAQHLFARKFDDHTDKKIIAMLYKHLEEEKSNEF